MLGGAHVWCCCVGFAQSSLPGLKKRKADYQSDDAQFEELIEKLEQHKVAMEQKREERKQELADNSTYHPRGSLL